MNYRRIKKKKDMPFSEENAKILGLDSSQKKRYKNRGLIPLGAASPSSDPSEADIDEYNSIREILSDERIRISRVFELAGVDKNRYFDSIRKDGKRVDMSKEDISKVKVLLLAFSGMQNETLADLEEILEKKILMVNKIVGKDDTKVSKWQKGKVGISNAVAQDLQEGIQEFLEFIQEELTQ